MCKEADEQLRQAAGVWRTLGETSSSWGWGQVGEFLDDSKYPLCGKVHDKHFTQLSEDLGKISDRVIEY